MTAPDVNPPINDGANGMAHYDAVVTATTSGLANIYDTGPIFAVDTSGLNNNGSISGQIFVDLNNNANRDVGEQLFGQDVIVTLLDCNGNPVNSVVTNNGNYTINGLFLKPGGASSQYVVQFDVVPKGYVFSSFVPGHDSQVAVGGRTKVIMVSSGSPTVANVDAGILLGGSQPGSGTGAIGTLFSETPATFQPKRSSKGPRPILPTAL